MTGADWYKWEPARLLLHLRVQPRAKHNEFAGLLGARLKVRITAPPVDGRANAQLIVWLAAAFGVSRSRIQLLAGRSGRDKTIAVDTPVRVPTELAQLGLRKGS